MASNSHQEPWLLENGNVRTLSKEMRHGRTHHYMSSSSFRRKSDLKLVSEFPISCLRQLLANLQEVILGTKLSVLFPAIPLAIAAETYGFGRPWVFALSLLGLTPLAERVSFLTEQIAYYTGPTEQSLRQQLAIGAAHSESQKTINTLKEMVIFFQKGQKT